MEFSNTLSESSASTDDKPAPHIFTGTDAPMFSRPPIPYLCNSNWTPAYHARWEHALHATSLFLGTLALAAYIFDLAKSASYHVHVPRGILIVDIASITFLAITILHSVYYFATGMNARLTQGDLSQRWPIYLDVALFGLLLGFADTTLATRSSSRPKSCDKNRAVGGCLGSRRALMIIAGVAMILVG
jgi:hypothetical protein